MNKSDIVILLVDDDPDNLEPLKDIIEGYGYQVLIAADGQQALDLFTSQRVDLVVSDHNMPRKTGLDFLKDIRGQNKNTPFILLTGYGDKGLREATAAEGGHFMSKPCEVPQLLRLLDQLAGTINPISGNITITSQTITSSPGGPPPWGTSGFTIAA